MFVQVKIGTQLSFDAGELEFQETVLDYPPARIGNHAPFDSYRLVAISFFFFFYCSEMFFECISEIVF